MSIHSGNLDETFLTVAEVAELLKLNQQTVRNWIDQGSLPAVRVGRRVRIRRSDLERLLEEGSTAAPAPGTHRSGPSAEDFWGGEAIAVVEPAPRANGRPSGAAMTDNP
jgi:excisionase family DNA binding protein